MQSKVLNCGYTGVCLSYRQQLLWSAARSWLEVDLHVVFSHSAFYVRQYKSCLWNDWWIFLHLPVFYMWHFILSYHVRCGGRHAVFFGINIEHSSTGWFCTWILTVTDAPAFASCLVVFSFHFRADEFHGWQTAAQVRFTSFPFHRKCWILWTAGNAVFIQGAVGFRKGYPAVKGNIYFLNGSFPKQIFIDLNRVKSCIIQKRTGINQRMLFKEIL